MDAKTKASKHSENVAVQSGLVQNDFTRVPGQRAVPLVSSRQKFVVYNMSHRSIPPLAIDPSKPGIRILRAFETVEDAVAYGQKISDLDTDVSVMVGPSAKWLLGAPDFDSYSSVQKEQDAVQKVLRSYSEFQEKNKREFDERVDKSRSVDTSSKKPASKKPASKKPASDRTTRSTRSMARAASFKDKNYNPTSNRITAELEDKDQQFSVLAVAHDPQCTDEIVYVVQFLQNFETEAAADAYVRNTAGAQYRDFDLVVARAYNWVELSGDDQNISTHYRDEKLDRILHYREDQQQEVVNYRDMCAGHEEAPRCIEIGEDTGVKVGVESGDAVDTFEIEPEPECGPASEPPSQLVGTSDENCRRSTRLRNKNE